MASARKTGVNEQVSTFGAPGDSPDYTDLAAWELDTRYDLVTADVSEVLECYAGVYKSSIYFGAVAGAGTDATHPRIIRPISGARHNGNPLAGVRFVFSKYEAFGYVFHMGTEYFSQVQDIVVSYPEGEYENIQAFVANGYEDNHAQYVGCIAYDIRTFSEAFGFACAGYNAAFVNCEAIRCTNPTTGNNLNGRGFQTTYWGDSDGHITRPLNCNAINCGVGFYGNTQPDWTNCLASGCDVNFKWDATDALSAPRNNASSDATAPGIGSRTGQTFGFVNAAIDDYHLTNSDTGAKGYGAILIADADYPFDDDIDGDNRPVVVWDIGFDQLSDGTLPPAAVPSDINDVLHILKDTCNQQLAEPIANRIRYRFARNYAEGKWDQELLLDDTVSQAALGEIKEEIIDLPWVRDAATALAVAQSRLDWMSEDAWRIELQAALPVVFTQTDLTHLVDVDHHAILGGVPLEYKVTERAVDVDQMRIKIRAVRNVG